MEDRKLDNWGEVNKKIEVSRIKRMPWKKILGESLTARIHRLRNKGHNSDEVYSILVRNPAVGTHCRNNPLEAQKLLENLKISVCARFGESKTAKKIWFDERKKPTCSCQVINGCRVHGENCLKFHGSGKA